MADEQWAEFGERVRRARLTAGVSRSDLAEAVGLDRTMIANVEADRRRLDALELSKVSAALAVPMRLLVDPRPEMLSHRAARLTDDDQTEAARSTERLGRWGGPRSRTRSRSGCHPSTRTPSSRPGAGITSRLPGQSSRYTVRSPSMTFRFEMIPARSHDRADRIGQADRNLGEASALALAQLRDGVAITGDADARRVARRHGRAVHGTVWLLARACRRQTMTEVAAGNVINELRRTGHRLPCTGDESRASARRTGLLWSSPAPLAPLRQ